MTEQRWKNALTVFLCFYFAILCIYPSGLDALKFGISVLFTVGLWHHYLNKKFFVDPILMGMFAFAAIALAGNFIGAGRFEDSLKILGWPLPFLLGKAYSQNHSGRINQTLVIGAVCLAAYVCLPFVLSLTDTSQTPLLELYPNYLILTFRHIARTAVYVAMACLICVFALLYWQGFAIRILAWPGLLILFPTLILTGRRMTLVAFLIISALLLFLRKKFLIPGLAFVATLLIINVLGQGERFDLNPERIQQTQSLIERQTVWYAAGQIFRESPFLGSGFNTFKAEAKPYVEAYRATHPKITDYESLEDAHNLILHVAAESGVTGLVAVLFLFIFSIWAGWKIRTQHSAALCLSACLLLVFFNLQLHSHLYSANIHGLVFLLMGMNQGLAASLETPS